MASRRKPTYTNVFPMKLKKGMTVKDAQKATIKAFREMGNTVKVEKQPGGGVLLTVTKKSEKKRKSK